MKLISQSFNDQEKLPNAHVFNQMGYEGENLSPHLKWSEVPQGCKSFAITCYDPDAPTGSGWWHWVVVNIPADVHEMAQGASRHFSLMPQDALETRTDFGANGYDGVAPPNGETHRYIFTVYALDVEKLDVDTDASGAMVGFNLHFHTLDKASITAFYQ